MELLLSLTSLSIVILDCLKAKPTNIVRSITHVLSTDLQIIYRNSQKLVKHVLERFTDLEFEQEIVGYAQIRSFKRCS